MKAGQFIWTVKADYTNGRIAIDDTLGIMSVALFKVHDGLNQMYSPQDAAQWANGVYRPQGIDFMPWGVARGFDIANAHAEGQLAGSYAAATGSEYILDLEPDKNDYWQGLPGTAHAFCAGYGETSGGKRLRICPDARTTGGLNVAEWAQEPIVGIWHPQMYGTAYGESLDRWFASGVKPITDAGVLKSAIYPVLALWYATAGEPSISPDDIERDIHYVHDNGFPGWAGWRRGMMSAQVVERVRAMPDLWAPTPPGPPQPPANDIAARAQVIINQATAILAEAA